MGVVTQWIEGRYKESPEELARILSILNYQGNLVSAGAEEIGYNCRKGGGCH